MPNKKTDLSQLQNIEQDAADLLGDFEKTLTAVTPYLTGIESTPDAISDEFTSLCLRMPSAPHEDVRIALCQMQAVIESLPLPILVQHANWLTLRTLLQFALESSTQAPRLRCGALGYLYLERHDASGKDQRTSEIQGELLVFFLMQPRRPWTDEQIFEALWSGNDQQHAQWSFHSARKRLHEFAKEQVILKLKRGQYVLNPDIPIWFDVAEFENLIARAYTIPTATARIKLLERAVQLYRGDFLEKNYKDWCLPIRSRLQEKYIGALLQLAELTQSEMPDQTIAWYETALRADDLNEDTWLKLIQLYLRLGNTISAHRTLVMCLETFQRELQTRPSELFLRTVRSIMDDNALLKFAKGA